jgi:hypothetical protein
VAHRTALKALANYRQLHRVEPGGYTARHFFSVGIVRDALQQGVARR